MSSLREVETPSGTIRYRLSHKKVKNLNLRLSTSGEITLSVPLRYPSERADRFIEEKHSWILSHLPDPRKESSLLPPVSREECGRLLLEAVQRVYPLVEGAGVEMPQLRLRKMKSQWGNCHYQQGYITLNTALARCPEELRDYVALHELVHFLHHNHGAGFYGAMDARMPDWKARRKELRGYVHGLDLRRAEE